MSAVIKVENLSKAYQIGEFSTGTISRDLERWWAGLRGKEDPFLKVGETNDHAVKGGSDVVWSLKDLNFEIEQGEAVGIIGKNGAGKSTLLKLLSRVTSPTTGSIKVKGRIASLLEVGTGFHPELTGRENIFLNGAILGMRKKEIKRRFDEIVDFAGVERYIDTPVKRYSSGMYVRLAFAVAAHLESEILIVDEVLAVGDAEFQKKCLGKMGEVSKGEGRTVLFVSHNMATINQLCQTSLLLKKGKIQNSGDTLSVIASYIHENENISSTFRSNKQIKKISVCQRTEYILVEAEYNYFEGLTNPNLGIVFMNPEGWPVFATSPAIENQQFTITHKNGGIIQVKIYEPKLTDGDYYITIFFGNKNQDILIERNCMKLSISGMRLLGATFPSSHVGNVAPKSVYNFFDR